MIKSLPNSVIDPLKPVGTAGFGVLTNLCENNRRNTASRSPRLRWTCLTSTAHPQKTWRLPIMTCNGPLPVFSYPSLPAGLVVPLLSIFAIPVCAQDVLTYHNNNFRNGAYTRETTLTPTNVNSAMFGKLFVLPADGLVDAEPLY